MTPRAALFDFNGTLSQDEELWFDVYRQLFAELGSPVSRAEYFEELVGLSDEELVRRRLGPDDPAIEGVVDEAVARYRAAAADGSTIPRPAREAVRAAAELVPVGVVTTARRDVVEEVLGAAGLWSLFSVAVAAGDVWRTKPHPEGYLRALHDLDQGLRARDVVVFEDTDIGVAAAKAAGMRCVAVLGTVPRERLAAADEIVDALDGDVVHRLLG